MKKIATAIIAGLILLPAGTAYGEDKEKLAGEARTIVKGFFHNLKGTLVGAMKAGGPVNAINVCRVKAKPISMEASKNSGWKVERTSLKLRNPSNKADRWEKDVLQKFEAKKAAGGDPKIMEHFEIVSVDDKKTFRYMKAIPTGKACLHCHGSALKPPVKAKLGQIYPDDKATGFKLGDIRGAFTLSKELN